MHLTAIHRKDARKQSAACDRAELWAGVGLVGDASAGREDRQVSLLDGALLPGLRQLGGLCTARFDANLITEGLDYALLCPGTRLLVGAARIEITAQGKRCFDECSIRQRGARCPLPDHCAFARVLVGGEIAVNDEIRME